QAEIASRKKYRERAAEVRAASQLNFAAKESRELAADSEAKAGAAVFPAGRRVRLLKSLEDDLLLFERNAYASVRHLECNDDRCLAEHGMVGSPAANRSRDIELDPALRCELEGIGYEVLVNLLMTFGVCANARLVVRVQ